MTAPKGLDPLRDYSEWVKSIRNFEGWLKGTKAPGATDIDALIERKGKFLVFEGKPWSNGVSIKYGQHLALQALAKIPSFTVYLIGECEDGAMKLMQYSPVGKPIVSRKDGGRIMCWWQPKKFRPASKESLQELVNAWWDSSKH